MISLWINYVQLKTKSKDHALIVMTSRWTKFRNLMSIDHFLITFFGVAARSESVFFFFFNIFDISLMISAEGRVSALSNFCICSKQRSFS